MAGMICGQAHLLDGVISLVSTRVNQACGQGPTDTMQLELSPAPPEKSLLARMTLTYSLGVEHGLYPGLKAAQDDEP